nr:uncharacterized protein LOC101264566 [Solanum lycopersicum]
MTSGGFRSSLIQLIIYFGKCFKVPLWGIQHFLLCDANSYPMGRVHKRAAYAGLRGKKKSTGHCLLLLSEPVADCHQTSFMEVQARHCVLIMKTPLYLSNGAEHYSPPWFSVAPMMKWTDNHYRILACLILRKTWLYPEMLGDETTVYQSGNLFVAEAMCIIAANTNVPVSVKCRIGINEHVHTVNYVRRKICFCRDGFSKGYNGFLGDVTKLEEFLKDPWGLKAKQPATCQVKVPKLIVESPLRVPVGNGDGEEAASTASAQTKRVALQKKAAAASSNVGEDFTGGFQSGDVEGSTNDVGGEEQGLSNIKVLCRLCFSSETEGGERARKMMSCNCCGKKYHLSCLKTWGQHRDLFHWSSWTCPSSGFVRAVKQLEIQTSSCFEKGVMQLITVTVCSLHSRKLAVGLICAPNIQSVRLRASWYLGYTCCDACGRLFVKGNYCQVCLKVYRDSETTPMVCCDICERWVHCECDGISDEIYLQFQVDRSLLYSCPECRGCSDQSTKSENVVQEIWRRRDLADRDLIANLRAGAGLPVEDEVFSISPFSDDEDTAPVVKNANKKSLKFSHKGLVDKSLKKSKGYGKKSGKEKGLIGQYEGHPDAPSGGYSAGDVKNDELQAYGELDSFFSPAGNLTEGICSFNMAGVIDDITGNTGKRTVQRKGSKPQRLDGDDVGIQTSMPKTSKDPKGVIHLGALDKNIAGSPKSDASSCQKEQDLTTSHGNEDLVQLRENENSERNETTLGDGKGNEDLVQLRENENSERNETTLGDGKGNEDLVQLRENEISERNETTLGDGKGNEDLVQLSENENSERNETTLGDGKGNEDLVQLRENENSERNETTLGEGKGNEDLVQLRENENSERNETTLGDGKESNLIKIKKVSSEATHFPAKVGGKFAGGSGPYPPLKTSGILGKRSNDSSVTTNAGFEVPATRDNKLASVKHAEAGLASCGDLYEEKRGSPSLSNSPRMDPRPLQGPKFKNPYHESQNAFASPGEPEKSMDKGHESKRKRSPAFEEKASIKSDDNSSQRYEGIITDDILSDTWILKRLGQNANGKRVQFHHLFDNTWQRGTVVEVFEGSSVVSVVLDDGKKINLELGQQAISLISSKEI